ncbi:hypothetical protein GLOIN_2v1785889 [Rhizophagus irregularis DAOM 181602=DAOM 197198]|nr:hypothetical protein GLOIN_2v1785889 [Rhizophagus irregularis DAOM 181602=DAOM 197198]
MATNKKLNKITVLNQSKKSSDLPVQQNRILEKVVDETVSISKPTGAYINIGHRAGLSVIPELVSHILEHIPSSNFGPHLLEVSPIWRAEAERVLWKRHKEAEEAYDRAVEKKEKANDALGQSLEEEGTLRELEWKAYQKACKELTDTRKKLTIVKGALERFGFQIYVV